MASEEAKSVILAEAPAATKNAHGCLPKSCTLAKSEDAPATEEEANLYLDIGMAYSNGEPDEATALIRAHVQKKVYPYANREKKVLADLEKEKQQAVEKAMGELRKDLVGYRHMVRMESIKQETIDGAIRYIDARWPKAKEGK